MRSIALINQKGGVGKTSTVVNLGAVLAERGKRVLALDLDPQANLTSWLLGPASEGLGDTVTEVICGEARLADIIVRTAHEGLDLVPANPSLSGAERLLATEIAAETVLRDALLATELAPDPDDPSFDLYDYLLIDCPPSANILSINAMTSVNEIIIPVQTEVLALNGLANVRQVITKIRHRLNPTLEVAGILLVMVRHNTNLAREVEASTRSRFGPLVYTTTIRECVRVAECPSHCLAVNRYAPNAGVTADYRRLVDEILAHEELRRSPPPASMAPVVTSRLELPAPPASDLLRGHA
jgi:chromosome partitioning protein